MPLRRSSVALVGVVLSSNTSLSGAEGKAYVEILQALFRRAEAMKAGD